MYSTSAGYKAKIYSGDARHRLRLSFMEDGQPDLFCEKLTVKQRIIPNGSKTFSLDNLVSTEAELIMHKIDISTIPSSFDISLGTLVGNDYEYVPLGTFNISDKPKTDKDKITIKLYDNAIKFDFNYNGEPLINEKKQQGYEGATKLEILQDICTQAGVQPNIESFLHSTDIVATYDNTITARAYISYLAEQSGAVAKIDRTGKLIFVYLNNLETARIPLSIVEKYSIGKPYEIGRVVYEDGIRPYKYPQEEVENKDNLFINASNPYIISQEQITSIYGLVNGFKVDSLNTGKIYGDPAIDPYDLIEIYNDKSVGQEVIAKTLATYTMTYTGKIINTYDTQIEEQARTENMSLKQAGEETLKRYVRSEINEVDTSIRLLAGEVHGADGTGGLVGQTNELRIDMYGTSGLVQSNIKDLEDLTNEYRISKDGFEMALKKSGNNLLMGTNFYDLSQWGWVSYFPIYEGTDTPNSNNYKYWYKTSDNTVYVSDDWDTKDSSLEEYNWTLTTYTKNQLKDFEAQEFQTNIRAEIIDNDETKAKFVSSKAINISSLTSRTVNIDSTKGSVTLSFKYKKLVENSFLAFYIKGMGASTPNYWQSDVIIKDYHGEVYAEDGEVHEYSIAMPIENNGETVKSVWLSMQALDTDTSSSYIEVPSGFMIGDLKLEYGDTATVWNNNMNEVYGKNYKMDINGFEIDSNGYIMHIDEDEVTGSYNNEVQFQLNKDRTYSRKGQFVITDQNGLITQKLANNIYVRYIE